MGLIGLRVGAGTAGVAALMVCIFTNTQTISEIRNIINKIRSVFIFLHFDASF
jgi:transposase-like protein